jgi:hypothetical protein
MAEQNLEETLKSMMKLLATLNAQEKILGKGALGIMYQNSKDVGLREAESLDHADNLSTALDLIADSHLSIWNIELWKDKGQDEETFEDEEGRKCAWTVWRECPLRQVCLSEGIEQDGAMCRMSYGLFAGVLSSILDEKIDIVPVETGPNACKKKVIWR